MHAHACECSVVAQNKLLVQMQTITLVAWAAYFLCHYAHSNKPTKYYHL